MTNLPMARSSSRTGLSRLRWTLVALLVASTALFAIGVIAERSDADEHAEPANAQISEAGEAEGAHEEAGGESEERTAGAGESEEDETLLGVDLESTPLIVLAVAVGLGLAALAATRFGQLSAFLGLVAPFALVWAA